MCAKYAEEIDEIKDLSNENKPLSNVIKATKKKGQVKKERIHIDKKQRNV